MYLFERSKLVINAVVVILGLSFTNYAADREEEKGAWEASAYPFGRSMCAFIRKGTITIHNKMAERIIVHLEGVNICDVATVSKGVVSFAGLKSESIVIEPGQQGILRYSARETGGVQKKPLSSEQFRSVDEASAREIHMVSPKLAWRAEGENHTVVMEDLSSAYKEAYNMNVSIAQTNCHIEAKPDDSRSNKHRVTTSRRHLKRLIEAKKGLNAQKEVVSALQEVYNEYYKEDLQQFKKHWF
ncbi:MAG TPA: hypothetical protein VEL47_04570 [Myxococcota bacterium]|nr:hypothetical protein [Myxococcota bacterium]